MRPKDAVKLHRILKEGGYFDTAANTPNSGLVRDLEADPYIDRDDPPQAFWIMQAVRQANHPRWFGVHRLHYRRTSPPELELR